MRILQILNYPGRGGAEQYAYLLAKKAVESGHKVMFIFGEDGPLVERIKALNIPYKFIKMRAPYDPFAVIGLMRVFRTFKPDVVQTHFMRENFLAIDAAYFVPVKAIFSTVHRLEPKNSLQTYVNRLYSKRLTSFIAVSDLGREYLEKEGIGRYKTVVIANGAEIKETNEAKIRSKLGLKGKEKLISHVGRFTGEKGHKSLIKAFEKANPKNAKLVLVGDGELLEGTQKRMAKSKRIIFAGGINNASSIIGTSDLYIQPSKIENMPMSVIEAMLQGVPILASDIPAHRLLLRNGEFGEYFKYGKVDELAKKITEALDSKELKSKAQKAKAFSQNKYTADRMWQETEKLYEKFI